MSLAVSTWQALAKSSSKSFGMPLVEPLQKYFNGLSHVPLINHSASPQSYITAIFVFALINSRYNDSPISSAISDHKWCYNIKGMDGGVYIANFNAIDGVLYALHQTLCDAVLLGAKNLCCAPANFTFMPYASAQFQHIEQWEPDLGDILVDQNTLLREAGFLQREYPAVFIVTQSGKAIKQENTGEYLDFLDSEVLKHVNPYTQRLNDLHIITSIHGAREIEKRWKQHGHLKEREMEKTLIVVSDEKNPDLIETQRIGEILYAEPYNVKYATLEGGVQLTQLLMRHNLVHQMNLTVMRPSILEQHKELNMQPDVFECAEIKHRPIIGFDYLDHDCCFTIFDPLRYCNDTA